VINAWGAYRPLEEEGREHTLHGGTRQAPPIGGEQPGSKTLSRFVPELKVKCPNGKGGDQS
jgi:hypothetical protein